MLCVLTATLVVALVPAALTAVADLEALEALEPLGADQP